MKTTMNTSKPSLDKRRVRQLLDRELRNKYVRDQIKIGLRNQLRSLRDERNVTQAELAEMIGTKQSVISRIERDPVRVGLPVFLDIAERLDVTFVARFEAIDTFTQWYDNLTPKKMTPNTSEGILREKAKHLLTGTSTLQIEQADIEMPTIELGDIDAEPTYRNLLQPRARHREDKLNKFMDIKKGRYDQSSESI